MVLEGLTGVLDELVELDAHALGDRETLVALHRQFNRLQAVITAATGAFEASGAWQVDKARSAAHWILTKTQLPKATVKAQVTTARVLRHLPCTETAWRTGDIALPHVRKLVAARAATTAELMARDENMLVAQAAKVQFRLFSNVVDYWQQHADPDGSERRRRDQHDRRRLHLSQSFENIWILDATLDPIAGGIVSTEIKRLETIMFKADWAQARTRLGREPNAADLDRDAARRRADALVEMAIRSRTAPPDGNRPEPLFTVLVGYETLKGRICQLDDGTVVTPGSLHPWLTTARLERIVFGTPSRVLDVGHARRLFTGATRRAVEVRDQECYHPYCDAPAPHCQVDHIIPYRDNGPTTQENGRLACDFHNRARPNSQPPTPRRRDGPRRQ